jgi:hypothetical protein
MKISSRCARGIQPSGPVRELRQMLPEREAAGRNFNQGKHDQHSDDKSKYRGEGFPGHDGLAAGLMMSQSRAKTDRVHMPLVIMASVAALRT